LTIFGNEYNGICAGLWPAVKNPDDITIGKIKRLLDFEKKARNENNNK